MILQIVYLKIHVSFTEARKLEWQYGHNKWEIPRSRLKHLQVSSLGDPPISHLTTSV
jgi:hypothetical protein